MDAYGVDKILRKQTWFSESEAIDHVCFSLAAAVKAVLNADIATSTIRTGLPD